MTKIGLLVNGSMSTVQKISIAQSLNSDYSRIPVYVGFWPYTPTAYNQWTSAGFNIILNLNWMDTTGGPVPFRTSSEWAAYGTTINNILNTISRPEIIVIENEEINPNYHSGPMSDYVGMLATASPIVHSFGLKITNGGIYGVGLDILTWRYFNSVGNIVQRDLGAQAMTPAQISAAANPGSNPTADANAAKVQAVLDASIYLDYINIHPYEVLDEYVADPSVVTNITPGVIAGYQAFILAETGLPTITNETGQRDNSQPDLVTNMLTEYVSLGFDYVVWFDGIGAGGALPLQEQTAPFALFDNGIAFRDFVYETDEAPSVVIDPSEVTILLPDNSVTVDATVTPGYLHSISSVLWTYISGPETYTITDPTIEDTTFEDLVEGVYVFRLTATQDDAQTGYAEVTITVTDVDDPPSVVIDTPDTTLYQPDNSLDVTATITPAYLHSISSVLWTFISGPATYTISSPTTADTTFGNLVIGTYRFRLTATQDDSQTAYAEIRISVVPTQTGIKYILRFLNRQQDTYRVELKPKNYSGIDREVEGTDTPFVLKYQSGDGNIYSPIRASEATVQFWTDGNISIEDFYNDDDTYWQVYFYGEKIFGQDAADVLLWTGFLQLDNSGEALQDYAHPISLNANDNLGLLKNIALPTPTDAQIYEGMLLTDLFASILKQTSLSLATRAYLNIFENDTEDREDVPTIDFLQQTITYTNNLQDKDGNYRKCYDILTDLLNTFRVQLQQCFGEWVLLRQGEFRLFADAQVPGTLYDADFVVEDSIILDPPVTIGRDEDIIPINENSGKRILRPLQYSQRQFDYVQPAQLIVQQDLSLPPGATPFATNTVDGIRYDDYSMDTYFPKWTHESGDTSYLEVATDIATDNEIERYMVTPGSTDNARGVRFNNIPVTAGDSFDFNLQFRTPTDVSMDVFVFRIRFLLRTPAGNFYCAAVNVAPYTPLEWTPDFDYSYPNDVIDDRDSTQWIQWNWTQYLTNVYQIPLIPEDGILLITVKASNDDTASGGTCYWKNINLTFSNSINKSLNVIGQIHNQSQTSLTKNISDTSIFFDDSLRNTVNGTLFRPPLVNFVSPIGDLYFYRTNRWHRANIDEAWRLNQIQTFDELFIQRKIRTIVEGDWFGLRYQVDGGWQYLTLQNILKINFLEGLNFIFGIVSFDYMKAQFTATFYECFDDGETDEDLDNTYTFTYLYKTT